MGLFRYTWRTLGREVLLLALGVLYGIPFYIVIVLSLKSNVQILTDPLSFPFHPDWHNYWQLWQGTANMNITIGRSLINSLIVTVGSVAVLICVGSLCGYTLARRQSKLSTGVYLLFVAGLIVPFEL